MGIWHDIALTTEKNDGNVATGKAGDEKRKLLLLKLAIHSRPMANVGETACTSLIQVKSST